MLRLRDQLSARVAEREPRGVIVDCDGEPVSVYQSTGAFHYVHARIVVYPLDCDTAVGIKRTRRGRGCEGLLVIGGLSDCAVSSGFSHINDPRLLSSSGRCSLLYVYRTVGDPKL